jgi:flagellar basal-body rod protein FlgC
MIELIPAARISSSGLDAERIRMRMTANNLANVHTTSDVNGEVYKKRIPVFESVMNNTFGKDPASDLGGVKLQTVAVDDRAPLEVYEPYNPNADEKGMVKMPRISAIDEMVTMISATRAYEANLSVMKKSTEMAQQTIKLGKG